MSTINNPHLGTDDPVINETGNDSPWIMLVTMLIMIAGLLFSSMLLITKAHAVKTSDGASWLQYETLAEMGVSGLFATGSQNDAGKPSAFQKFTSTVQKTISGTAWWPKLEYTGQGKNFNGEECAFINGELIPIGEYYKGVKVVKILSNSVEVEYKGQRKVLTVKPQD